MEKLNLTRQNHAFINQKKYITTQDKHKKLNNKAGFSRLLRHLAWKRSGSILKGKDKFWPEEMNKEKVKKKDNWGSIQYKQANKIYSAERKNQINGTLCPELFTGSELK